MNKQWLKENWFKISIITLGTLSVLLFGYNQYLNTKVHSLERINQILHCVNSNLNKESISSCSEKIKSTRPFSKFF